MTCVLTSNSDRNTHYIIRFNPLKLHDNIFQCRLYINVGEIALLLTQYIIKDMHPYNVHGRVYSIAFEGNSAKKISWVCSPVCTYVYFEFGLYYFVF